MVTLSAILTVGGLALELFSSILLIRRLFWDYNERIDDMGKPIQTQIKEDRRIGAWVLELLIGGMIFQALAVLI